MDDASDEACREFQRRVDRLCSLIVASDCSEREIDIERLHLRVQAAKLFPDKMRLYDWVYESRFRRLREQFRAPGSATRPIVSGTDCPP